jgi:uncharacterized membrane protein
MPRIETFDLARGFTVLCMPAVHSVLLYSSPSVHSSPFGLLLTFIAEGPGAPLLTFLMGASLPFARVGGSVVLKRTIFLLVAGYGLNLLKFVVPYWLGWLPDALLHDLGCDGEPATATSLFLLGDIFQFAAIAYPVLWLLHRLQLHPFLPSLIAFAIMIISPQVWDVKSSFVFVNRLLDLLGGHPPVTYFPVFPWICYPLFGLTVGRLIKRNSVGQVLTGCGWVGLPLLAVSCLFKSPVATEWPAFYRTQFAGSLFHLALVLCWLNFVQRCSPVLKDRFIGRLLKFCSRHITLFYILQWIIICWCLPIFGYGQLGLLASICSCIALTSFTLFITFLVRYVQRNL